MIPVAFPIGDGLFQAASQIDQTAAINDAGTDDTGDGSGIQSRSKISRRDDILNLRRPGQAVHRRREGA